MIGHWTLGGRKLITRAGWHLPVTPDSDGCDDRLLLQQCGLATLRPDDGSRTMNGFRDELTVLGLCAARHCCVDVRMLAASSMVRW